MEKTLYFYKYINGNIQSPFPNESHQISTSEFRADYKRMGGAPTISCTIKDFLCLDELWDDSVHVEFNGERFFLKQTPTSSYGNTDSRYIHEVELVGERIILDNVYFYDVVSEDISYDKPVSNSSDFTFHGDIFEFAKRLNFSLLYSCVGYTVVVDSGVTSEAKSVSFQNQFISNAIQECYNSFNIPYYFDGKVIHFGYTNNVLPNTLKYGVDESLLTIQKQNANFKIVNKATGTGSEDNIPYYYPNDFESKSEVEANGGVWIAPQKRLMPSIYRESLGSERFYKALNNTYINPNTGGYYVFDNPYIDGKPHEHIVDFEDIKPTIKGMKNASLQGIDSFIEFAYDENDSDETDEEGNYLHPYFFGKLRRFDGEHGFNLFDHAIEESEMTISMTSGACGACEFVIGVSDETQKNLVQVDDNGNLLRDDNGNVRCGREGMQIEEPQERQNDTRNNEVWVALKKDINTFGTIMPSVMNRYYPSAGDTFVILHINLPKAYILAAEKRLEDSIIEYMANNNNEKFDFSISFSRIYFEENPDVLSTLNENSRIQIEYNSMIYELYVSSYSYAMTSDKPLPEIRVELTDTLAVTQNALQNAISEIKSDLINSIGGSQIATGSWKYLRKDVDDRSKGAISSDRGLYVGYEKKGISINKNTRTVTALLDILKSVDFTMGEFGNGFILKYENGESYFEIDRMLVRKAAYFVELIIKQLSHVGGTVVLTPASMRCSKVEEYEEYYRCYFENEKDGKSIEQEFKVGDQARCQTFNVKQGVNHNVSSQYYWRLVVGIGDNYIDLSKIDCDLGSLAPLVGDDIVQLGNRNDETRQNAIILSSIGEDAPSIKQYEGINSYSLEGKEVTVISPYGNKFKGQFVSKANVDYEDILDSFGNRIDIVETQTDKTYMIWFYPHVPTLDNLPASEWVDDSVKEEHIKDMFYVESEDGLEYGEAGRAYRFVYSDSKGYYWEEITDKDTIQALEDAAKAQGTADSKIRNFVDVPYPPYEIGDRWCNATWKDENNEFIYDNDDLVCINSKTNKETDKFNINDWQPVSSQTSENRKLVEAEIKNLGDSLELITSAFVKDEDGNLVLTEQAGLNITSGMAQIYARKDDIINSINVSTEGITISSDKINIEGAVKFSSLNKELQDTIDNKVDTETIIEGGYIKTSLIDVDNLFAKNLDADNGTVGGWFIGFDYISNAEGNTHSGVINSARLSMYSVSNPVNNFLTLNPDNDALIAIRADNKRGMTINSNNENGLCLYMTASTGSLAAEVYGGVSWFQRKGDAWNMPGLLAIVQITNASSSPSITRLWGEGCYVSGISKTGTGNYTLYYTSGGDDVYPIFLPCNPLGDKPYHFVSTSVGSSSMTFKSFSLADNEYESRDAISFYIYLFGRNRSL